MAEPFIGEIKAVAYQFAPWGWAICAGQLMPIYQNGALFSLIWDKFGGDGRVTFALPDLRGRAIVAEGTGPGLIPRRIGEWGGREATKLTSEQLPKHSHTAVLSGNAIGTYVPNASTKRATDHSPAGKIPAVSQTNDPDRPLPIRSYIDPGKSDTQMADNTVDIDLKNANLEIGYSGNGQSFNNMQPYLVMNYVIALDGLYPDRRWAT